MEAVAPNKLFTSLIINYKLYNFAFVKGKNYQIYFKNISVIKTDTENSKFKIFTNQTNRSNYIISFQTIVLLQKETLFIYSFLRTLKIKSSSCID